MAGFSSGYPGQGNGIGERLVGLGKAQASKKT